jgi:transposase
LLRPERHQLGWEPVDIDGLIPEDHRARAVWAYVEELDLSAFEVRIRAVEGRAGAPAIDPRILVALWLYATLEGVGSARALERLCQEHHAYRWLCGGVGVNHHTLSDFRCGHGEKLDRLLSESVAALREEVDDDPGAASGRRRAARERAAAERAERVRRALAEREKVAQVKGKDARRRGAAGDARASTTDPEARAMKMADGGSRPAYNAQFCTAAGSQVIVGVEATNQGNDVGLLDEMIDQIERRHGRLPRAALVDGGFVKYDDIERLGRRGTLTYSPVPVRRCDRRGPHEPHDGDGPAVAEWRSRMGTPAGRQVYGRRAPTGECVNALARNRGLRRVFVRGLKKVRSVLLLFALAHNLVRAAALRVGAAAAA